MRIRPWRFVAIALIIVLLSFTNGQAADPLRIGIYENTPLSSMANGEKPEGFFVDIINQIAQEEDWQLNFVSCEFADCLNQLEINSLDLVGAVAQSPERSKRIAYHQESVLSNWGVIYSSPSLQIDNFSDLAGLKVAALEDDIYLDGYQELSGSFQLQTELVIKGSYQEVLSALSEGEVDAAILNRFFGAQSRDSDIIQETSVVFSPVDLFFAASPNTDPAILAAIDQWLIVSKADKNSIYFQALDRHITETSSRVFPSWLIYGLLIFGGLGLISGISAVVLRLMIDRRTKSLQESEEKYRRFFKTSRSPIFITSREGKWVDVNDAMLEFFGYKSREEFMQIPVPDFYFNSEDRPHHLEIIDREGFIKDFPVDMVYKNGSILHTLITTTTVTNPRGEILGYQGTITDITDMEQTQRILNTNRERLDLAITGTDVGLWDWDITSDEVNIDKHWVENLGFQPEDFTPCTIEKWNKLIHPADLEKSYKLLAQHFAGDLKRYECEIRMKNKLGDWRWVLSRGKVVEFQRNGEPVRMVGTYLDITDRIQANLEIEEYAAQLEALHVITRSISSSLSFRDILDHLLDQLAETLDFVSASVFMLEENQLRILTVRDHPHREDILGKTFPTSNPLFQEFFKTKRPLIIDNAQRDARFQSWGETIYAKGWMGVPLVAKDEVLGFITLDSDQISAYGSGEAKLARIFATQVAHAIHNARLYEQIQEYADELEDRIEDRTRELSRMVDLMAGREIRMMELKKVIQRLRDQLKNAGIEPLANDPLDE